MAGISKRIRGSWVSSDYGVMKTDTDTITTLPAVLYPNDTTATMGLKGNMSQTGTPTPDNPITPSECGERTRNLFDKTKAILNAIVTSDDGERPYTGFAVSDYIAVSEGAYYLTNVVGSQRQITLSTFDTAKTFTGTLNISGGEISSGTVVIDNNTKYIRVNMSMKDDNINSVMLNTGSTPLPYEPYGYKIPISSANTTTPVYLGEIESTRRIRKLVLTGEEDITVSGAYYNVRTGTQKPISRNGLISTHFIAATDTISIGTCRFGGTEANPNDVLIVNYDNGSGGLDNFKSYLSTQSAAGTPVTVWYVLATETTGIVNEPLMKIGEYADEVSNISIPVTTGGDTISVGTTLQPSEVTVNYKGWHPVQSAHERDNGAWT